MSAPSPVRCWRDEKGGLHAEALSPEHALLARYLEEDVSTSLEAAHELQKLAHQVASGRVKAAWSGTGKELELALTPGEAHIGPLTVPLPALEAALSAWIAALAP